MLLVVRLLGGGTPRRNLGEDSAKSRRGAGDVMPKKSGAFARMLRPLNLSGSRWDTVGYSGFKWHTHVNIPFFNLFLVVSPKIRIDS